MDLEIWILFFFSLSSLLGSYFLLRTNWKKYGFLYILSAATSSILCLIFVYIGFYSFPVSIPRFPIPIIQMFTVIPFFVILAVTYSPVKWPWKIAFYWALVHMIMLLETLFLYKPIQFIQYHMGWDFWDSYTLWWVYFLLFEWIGGRIVPSDSRKPIPSESFRYGKWAWTVFHAIVISTIFLGGFYLGRVTK